MAHLVVQALINHSHLAAPHKVIGVFVWPLLAPSTYQHTAKSVPKCVHPYYLVRIYRANWTHATQPQVSLGHVLFVPLGARVSMMLWDCVCVSVCQRLNNWWPRCKPFGPPGTITLKHDAVCFNLISNKLLTPTHRRSFFN